MRENCDAEASRDEDRSLVERIEPQGEMWRSEQGKLDRQIIGFGADGGQIAMDKTDEACLKTSRK